MMWGVNSDRHQGSTLASTSTTVSYQAGARLYPEPQPGRRWSEYELPLNTRSDSNRLTPPPPYVPFGQYNVPKEPELPPPPPPPPEIELSEEQKRVLQLVHNGKNIFFTGPAGKLAQFLTFVEISGRILLSGTGKSVLLRAIIKSLQNRFGVVAITAPTGIAGVNIGGLTIHSWAGIRLGKEGVDSLVDGLSRFAKRRWESTHALVIDESAFDLQ
jgi:ATP-dependent DNA helicase PIF1